MKPIAEWTDDELQVWTQTARNARADALAAEVLRLRALLEVRTGHLAAEIENQKNGRRFQESRAKKAEAELVRLMDVLSKTPGWLAETDEALVARAEKAEAELAAARADYNCVNLAHARDRYKDKLRVEKLENEELRARAEKAETELAAARAEIERLRDARVDEIKMTRLYKGSAERLEAEVLRMRAVDEESLRTIENLAAEIDALLADHYYAQVPELQARLVAQEPVVAAALAWVEARETARVKYDVPSTSRALFTAIDAYRQVQRVARCSFCGNGTTNEAGVCSPCIVVQRETPDE